MSDISHGMGRGILWGSVAATAVFILSVPLFALDPVTGEAVAVIPGFFALLLFVLVVVATAAIVIGLPLVALLERLDCAGAETGALAGAVAGVAVIWTIALAGGGTLAGNETMFTVAAMTGGGVLGAVWGHHLHAEDHVPEVPAPLPDRVEDRRMLR